MTYQLNIDLYIFPDNDVYIAYCPSLDLITCDKTFDTAITAFYEMFQLYAEGCIEDGTLHDDLIAHGWKVNKKEAHAADTDHHLAPTDNERPPCERQAV